VQANAPQSLIGEIAAVTITEIGSNSLFGTLADRAAANMRPTPTVSTLVATGV
jgi:hypothetical protein